MRLLLDTNTVLRTVNQDDALYGTVSGAVQRLAAAGHELVIVPQVVYEFWSVASRPAQVNGWGWRPGDVRSVVDDLTKDWTLLHDTLKCSTAGWGSSRRIKFRENRSTTPASLPPRLPTSSTLCSHLTATISNALRSERFTPATCQRRRDIRRRVWVYS